MLRYRGFIGREHFFSQEKICYFFWYYILLPVDKSPCGLLLEKQNKGRKNHPNRLAFISNTFSSCSYL